MKVLTYDTTFISNFNYNTPKGSDSNITRMIWVPVPFFMNEYARMVLKERMANGEKAPNILGIKETGTCYINHILEGTCGLSDVVYERITGDNPFKSKIFRIEDGKIVYYGKYDIF